MINKKTLVQKDHYAVLGVTPQAEQAAIDEAFIRFAEKYYADLSRDGYSAIPMDDIGEAWQVLSDRMQRESYDALRFGRRRHRGHRIHDAWTEKYRDEVDATKGWPGRLRILIRSGLHLNLKWSIGIAIAVDILLIGCLLLLNDLEQALWITGIAVGACLVLSTIWRALSAGRATILGLSSFLAGVALASGGFWLFAQAPQLAVRQPVPAAKVAAAAQVPTPTDAPIVASKPVLPTAEPSPTATSTAEPGCPKGCAAEVPGCAIKAKIAAEDGSKLFYVPSDPDYYHILIDPGAGDRWFCKAADAQAAGWKLYVRPPTPTPTLATTPTPAYAIQKLAPAKVSICSQGANVREGPGTNYQVVSVLFALAEVTVQGKSGEWYYLGQNAKGQDQFVNQSLFCGGMRPLATTPTPQATATRQATVAATRVAFARPTATSVGYKYAAPVLTAPSNGSTITCAQELHLEWQVPGAGALKDGEWFVLETKSMDKSNWYGMVDWTNDNWAILVPVRSGGGDCDLRPWPGFGTYEWRVLIVRGDKATHTIQQILSPWSQSRVVRFNR